MLSIDLDGLEDKVKPKLQSTMRYLKNAQNILYSINIPSDFAYNSDLRSMPRTISEINSEVNSNVVWVESVIENFDTAEGNNKGIFDEVLQKVEEICGIENISEEDARNEFIEWIEDEYNATIGYFSDEWDDITTLLGAADYEIYKILKKIYGTNFTLKDYEDYKEKLYKKQKEKEKSDPLGYLADRWNAFTGWLMDETPVGTVVATAGNGIIAFYKGVANFGESLIDIGAIGLTLANTVPGVRCISRKSCSIFTVYGIDLITYGSCLISGDVDEFESFATKHWNWTMSFVAEEHVNNFFDEFYDTSVGGWLDSHAWEPFRSDGTAFELTEGAGNLLRYSSIIYSYWWYLCTSNSRYGCCWRRSRILLGKAKRFFNGRY